MFCNKCGANIQENAKFCDKCGTPVNDRNQQAANSNIGGNNIYNSTNANNASAAASVKGKRKLPIIIGVIVAIVILIIAFGSGDIDAVETVKKGCLTQFSSTVTIGEAFDNRFEDGEWSFTKNTISEDAYNVYFTGYDPLTKMNWKISFYLEGTGDNNYWIEVDNISADGNMENDPTNIYYLMSYIYTGNLNEYYNDLGTALWDAVFSAY